VKLSDSIHGLNYSAALLAFFAVMPLAAAQNVAPPMPLPPAFEAVSVRMVDSHTVEDLSRGIGLLSMSSFPTNLFTLKNAPLAFLVQLAYNVDSQEHISAMPGWMESQEYDISAKVEGDRQLTLEQIRPMLQRLLEQRFHFATHHETKVTSGFALVVAKGGPKLQLSKDDGKPFAQILPNRMDGGHMETKQIAGVLAHRAGQPVVDKTGLTGVYDFKLSYAPANDASSDLPDFFTALQEQLGLKLQPDKVPVEFLVVDHADKIPTEN
jgi:uncharacterized protein (TIGR03435 family)